MLWIVAIDLFLWIYSSITVHSSRHTSATEQWVFLLLLCTSQWNTQIQRVCSVWSRLPLSNWDSCTNKSESQVLGSMVTVWRTVLWVSRTFFSLKMKSSIVSVVVCANNLLRLLSTSVWFSSQSLDWWDLWGNSFCNYRQHCAKRNLPVFNLLRGRFWGFSPCRADTLHRLGWNLAWSLLHAKFHPNRCNDGCRTPKIEIFTQI